VEGAPGADAFQFLLELFDLDGDAAAVRLQFGFAGAARTDAATEAGERFALTGEARQDVLELRQFDLKASFSGSGTGSKNIKDELSTVNDLDDGGSFEIALLGGGEVVVDDDNVRVEGFGEFFQLLDFALAEKRGSFNIGPDLEDLRGDFSAG